MKYFDKAFFKFLLGFICLLAVGIFFLNYVQAHAASLVNINTASSAELQTLSGIGPTYAQRIIDYRVGLNGPFETIEEIKNVSGIGDVTFDKIKDLITVGVTSAVVGANPENTNTFGTTTSIYNGGDEPVLKVGISAMSHGTVGVPVEFRVVTNNSRATFYWSFGDGSATYGAVVSHTYNFSGKYIVTLKASYGGEAIRSKLVLTIGDDTLSIMSATPEKIVLVNNGKEDVDLSGRVLYAGDKKFVVPPETFIMSGQKLAFSNKVTKLTPRNIYEADIALTNEGPNFPIAKNLATNNALTQTDPQMAIITPSNELVALAIAPQSLHKKSWLALIKDFFSF